MGEVIRFDGRINRSTFWKYMVVVIVVSVITSLMTTADNSLLVVIGAVIALATIPFSLSASIRRWHDRGKSGWWVLIALVPVIGSLWALIETGFLPGTPGPNQYGSQP